ncbi:MAG: hypothetical protein SOZ62_02840 [Eubacteriales bacterium]|nr:hypothetical protein [Eubacteriales bacterium]
MKRIQDNIVEVNLLTRETEKGRLNLPKERLEASAKILANILLDYARNGGDMDDLTPDKVFGNTQKSEWHEKIIFKYQ